jgi:hypothetical protein
MMRWIVRIPDATARHVEGHFFVDLYLQRGLFWESLVYLKQWRALAREALAVI